MSLIPENDHPLQKDNREQGMNQKCSISLLSRLLFHPSSSERWLLEALS